jgi:hypothetical protein
LRSSPRHQYDDIRFPITIGEDRLHPVLPTPQVLVA